MFNTDLPQYITSTGGVVYIDKFLNHKSGFTYKATNEWRDGYLVTSRDLISLVQHVITFGPSLA